MGKGICSRRQRRIFQSFLLLIFVCGTLCAFMVSYEMHKELKKTEATALKYQQHQESLSAQLQGRKLMKRSYSEGTALSIRCLIRAYMVVLRFVLHASGDFYSKSFGLYVDFSYPIIIVGT